MRSREGFVQLKFRAQQEPWGPQKEGVAGGGSSTKTMGGKAPVPVGTHIQSQRAVACIKRLSTCNV